MDQSIVLKGNLNMVKRKKELYNMKTVYMKDALKIRNIMEKGNLSHLKEFMKAVLIMEFKMELVNLHGTMVLIMKDLTLKELEVEDLDSIFVVVMGLDLEEFGKMDF